MTPSECAHLLAAASRALAWLPPSAAVLEAYARDGQVRLHLVDPVDGPALAWRPAVPGNAYQAEWSYQGPSGVVVFGLLDAAGAIARGCPPSLLPPVLPEGVASPATGGAPGFGGGQ